MLKSCSHMSLELFSNFFIIPNCEFANLQIDNVKDVLIIDVSNTSQVYNNKFNFLIYNNKLNDKNIMHMVWNSYSNCSPIYVCYDKMNTRMLEYFLADFIKVCANGKQYKKELGSIIQTNLQTLLE